MLDAFEGFQKKLEEDVRRPTVTLKRLIKVLFWVLSNALHFWLVFVLQKLSTSKASQVSQVSAGKHVEK